jgi:plastocyanin
MGYFKEEWIMEVTNLAQVKSFHWRSLLDLAALANLAVLLFMGLAHGDILALVLGTITMIGLALTCIRNGLLGVVILGLLFADIAGWTVSGAVNNFLHREQGMALLLPSFLGVISLTGLAAVAGLLINWRKKQTGSGFAVLVGSAGLTLLFVVTLASLFVRGPVTPDIPGTSIVLDSKSMLYSSSDLTASEGHITLTLANDDLWWHTFTIDELDVDLHVPMGAERSVTFSAPAGEYRYYCGIPGHEAIGMYGTLTVSQ